MYDDKSTLNIACFDDLQATQFVAKDAERAAEYLSLGHCWWMVAGIKLSWEVDYSHCTLTAGQSAKPHVQYMRSSQRRKYVRERRSKLPRSIACLPINRLRDRSVDHPRLMTTFANRWMLCTCSSSQLVDGNTIADHSPLYWLYLRHHCSATRFKNKYRSPIQ